MKRPVPRQSRWSVYVVRTADDALYTGIALDVAQRVRQHAVGHGAKALRGRGPLAVVYHCALGPKGLALRVEHRLQRLARSHKVALVATQPSRAGLLRALGLLGLDSGAARTP